jgi:hypothetical protein
VHVVCGVPPRELTVLCCAVLCCAVLCCAVLCCAVLCCAVVQGWKVLWIPQGPWMMALNSKKNQHRERYELLVDLTLSKEPFETRHSTV